MKIIRFLYRQMNLNTAGPGRRKIIATLIHTLRMQEKDKKKPQWDNALSKGNLLWFQGQCQRLDDYSDEQKQIVFDEIVPLKQITSMSRVKTQRRQYKSKIKNAVAAERKAGHDKAADLLETLIHVEDSIHIDKDRYECLRIMNMCRPKQRMNMVKRFINAHNKLVNTKPTKNATHVQEGILKIPHCWHVGSDVVSSQDFIDFTEKFLSHYFPHYPIHAIVVHADEREKEELTGTHCHYFLSGQETVYGNWDLLKTQIEVVNSYQNAKNKRIADKVGIENFVVDDCDALLPVNCILTQAQMKVHGERLQQMFFEFVNENLLHKKGLHAERAPDEERNSEESKKRDREAKLPKHERSFNYASRQLEMKQLQIIEADEELIEKAQALRLVQALLNRDGARLSENRDILLELDESISNQKEALNKINKLLTSESIQYQSELCASIYARCRAKNIGLDKAAVGFAEKMVTMVNGAMTPELKNECIRLIKGVEGIEAAPHENGEVDHAL